VLPASADPHHFLLKLANGTSVPWTGEPGSAPSTITVAGVAIPVVSVQDLGAVVQQVTPTVATPPPPPARRARAARPSRRRPRRRRQAVDRAAEAVRAAEPGAVEVQAADHDRAKREGRVGLTGAERRKQSQQATTGHKTAKGSSFG
jgi:hypothetical protein